MEADSTDKQADSSSETTMSYSPPPLTIKVPTSMPSGASMASGMVPTSASSKTQSSELESSSCSPTSSNTIPPISHRRETMSSVPLRPCEVNI